MKKTSWTGKYPGYALFAGTLALAGAGAFAALNAYRVQDAMGHTYNAEIQGNTLYLLDKGGKSRAPDGSYRIDGVLRQVQGGLLLPAVQVTTPGAGLAKGDSSAHSNMPAKGNVPAAGHAVGDSSAHSNRPATQVNGK